MKCGKAFNSLGHECRRDRGHAGPHMVEVAPRCTPLEAMRLALDAEHRAFMSRLDGAGTLGFGRDGFEDLAVNHAGRVRSIIAETFPWTKP